MKRALVLTLVACTGGGGSTGTSDGGAAGADGGPPASAVAQAIVRVNGGAAASCAKVPSIAIGDFPDTERGAPSRPVRHGSDEQGLAVTVECRVARRAAGEFELTSQMTLGSKTLNVEGVLDASGATTAGKMLLKDDATTWTAATCRFDAAADPSMGVAAGRYWALLSCTGATAATGETCDVSGQIRLENCKPD